MAPRAAQTIIDDDGTFLVNGLPFFPLGIYHISPDDFREAKRMGLNTVQFWAWHGIADKYGIYPHISSASANGLKLLLELNHRSKEVVREKAEQFRDNPAFLMWYSVDELSESGYSEAQMMKDTFHEFDDNHPVYSLSCRPDAFAEQSEYCDVFAIDPYGDTKRVLDWTTNAYAAVEGKKPLVVVPASFANSKPEVYRSQLYVSLASGARGVIWYPWSQAGGGPLGVGLKNHPEAQNVVSQLCSEVNMMLPSLTRVDRRLFASDCGSIRALSMHEGWGITLLLVNATDKPVKAKMKIPNFEKDNRDLRDFFKKDSKPELKIVGGEFEIELKPFETRVFSR